MVAAVAPDVAEYIPVGGCADFYAATDSDVVAVGPAGTGKTMAACWKLHHTALYVPGVRLLMARKVLEDLKAGALATYTNHIQPQLDGVVTFGGNRFYPGEFRYPNGSVIHVVGMDKPGKVMSAEYDIIFVNEATEIDEVTWQALKSRLRNNRLAYQQLIADCNPAGPRHWLNVRCNTGSTRRIQTTHKDNPAYWDATKQDWTPLGRTYVNETLAGLTGVQRKRLFEGVWAAAEGIVYPEFVPEMIRAEGVEGWTTYLAVDIGGRNPTAVLTCHVAGDGRVHVSRELYRRNMTATEIVAAIESEADAAMPARIMVDSAGKEYIDNLVRDGYPAVGAKKGKDSVVTGIQQVKATLRQGFSIDPSCINTIDEFGLYAYPENPRIESDNPTDDNNHSLDALRYLVNGLTRTAPAVAAAGMPQQSRWR